MSLNRAVIHRLSCKNLSLWPVRQTSDSSVLHNRSSGFSGTALDTLVPKERSLWKSFITAAAEEEDAVDGNVNASEGFLR